MLTFEAIEELEPGAAVGGALRAALAALPSVVPPGGRGRADLVRRVAACPAGAHAGARPDLRARLRARRRRRSRGALPRHVGSSVLPLRLLAGRLARAATPFLRGTTTTRLSGSRARSSTRSWVRPVIGSGDCAWGLLDGVNDAGLAVSLAFGGRKVVGSGFGVPLVVRYLLETCETTEQARATLRRLPYHLAHTLTIVDRAGDVCTAYLSPDREVVLTDAVVATNHQGRVEWHEHARATNSVEREQASQRLRRRRAATAGAVRRGVPATAALCHRRRPPLAPSTRSPITWRRAGPSSAGQVSAGISVSVRSSRRARSSRRELRAQHAGGAAGPSSHGRRLADRRVRCRLTSLPDSCKVTLTMTTSPAITLRAAVASRPRSPAPRCVVGDRRPRPSPATRHSSSSPVKSYLLEHTAQFDAVHRLFDAVPRPTTGSRKATGLRLRAALAEQRAAGRALVSRLKASGSRATPLRAGRGHRRRHAVACAATT